MEDLQTLFFVSETLTRWAGAQLFAFMFMVPFIVWVGRPAFHSAALHPAGRPSVRLAFFTVLIPALLIGWYVWRHIVPGTVVMDPDIMGYDGLRHAEDWRALHYLAARCGFGCILGYFGGWLWAAGERL